MDKTKSAIWRMRGKRALSVLLSTALVVSMGTGISFVTKTAQKAEAATKPFVMNEPAGAYNPSNVKNTVNGTWSTGIYVAKTSQTVTNVKISGTVFVEIHKGVTLTCNGDNASGRSTPGKPGIELTSGSNLIVLGEGTLVANGGDAAGGSSGNSGGSPSANGNEWAYSGAGGNGGDGGAGAGAGIGTQGGTGGSGGSGGSSVSRKNNHQNDGYTYGNSGKSGSAGGSVSTGMGTLYVLGSVKVTAKGGSAGNGGSGGSFDSSNKVHIKRDQGLVYHDRHGWSIAGAGGGGGAGGAAGAGIGIGGAGGSGGGGGASAGVYVKDSGDNWSSWSILYPGGGSGGKGGRNGSNGSGSKGRYGGSGGSAGSSGYSTGSTTTVLRNNLASVSTSGNGGKSAGISSRTKLSYNQSVTIAMKDEKTGVVTTDKEDNISKTSKSPTTYATVRAGYSSFDSITDITNKDIHKPGYTFLGWYDGSGNNAKCVIDADGNIVQNVTDYTCQGVYNSVANPLYAHWKRNTYNLTFNANGGGFKGNRKEVSQDSYTGESLKELTSEQSPTRTGYFLLGYNTEKDGTGEWIYGTDNNKTQDKGTIVSGFWRTILAERASESEEHLSDDKIVKEVNTSAATFLKTWDTNKKLSATKAQLKDYLQTGITLEGVYPYEEDTTVYAQWAPIHYTLRYFSEDSTSEAQWLGDDYNVPYFNVAYKELSYFDVTRKHYDFKGWNVYASQTWGMYEPKKLYRTSLTDQDGATVSLYAAWQMTDSYTISYNGNGGAGTPVNGYTFKDSNEKDDDTYVISSKIPTRENYTFTGWNTEIDGTGTEWKSGTKVTGAGINYKNLTLYAQWKLNPSVTYHANGGSFSVTPDKKYIKAGEKFTTLKDDEIPSRDGYEFKGWATSPTAESQEYNAGDEMIMPEKSLILYAVWEKEGYGVSATVYNDDPDNNSKINEYYGIELEQKDDSENTTYKEFGRQVVNGESGSGYEDKEMSIIYTAKKSDGSDFKVKFKEDFGFRVKVPDYVDTSDMVVYANGAVLIAKKKQSENGNTYFYYTVTKATAAQEISVTGLKYHTYNVTLNANDGSVAESDDITSYIYGTKVTLPTPSRKGYTFKGWYANKDLTGDVVTEISATEKGDKTFYAQWEANKYSITYDGTVYEEDSDAEDGYKATDKGGITSSKQKTYTVDDFKYDESKALDMSNFKYHTDTTKYIDTDTAYDNYDDDIAGKNVTFLGWSTKKGAESPEYLTGMRVFNLCTGADGDKEITLYAVWKVENSKVTYNGNGGKIEQEVVTAERDSDGKVKLDEDGNPITHNESKKVSSYTHEQQTGTEVKLNFDNVTRDGYKFLGWTTKLVDDEGQPVTTPEYYTKDTYSDGKNGSNDTISASDFVTDKVLYAVWQENTYTVTFNGSGAETHQKQTNGEGVQKAPMKAQILYSLSSPDNFSGPVYKKTSTVPGVADTYYIKDDSKNKYYKFNPDTFDENNYKWTWSFSPSNVVLVNDINKDDLATVYAHLYVYTEGDSNSQLDAHPIFRYKDSNGKVRYLCAKTDIEDSISLYEVKSFDGIVANTGGIPIDDAHVSTSAFTDGSKKTYANFKDELEFVYSYDVLVGVTPDKKGKIHHTDHTVDGGVFTQNIKYTESAYLGMKDGEKIFDVSEGGKSYSDFTGSVGVDLGINGFTGFYKKQSADETKMAYLLGWSTKENATEPDYLQNERVEKIATGGSITLNAVWSDEPVSYAMFNANGGKFTSGDAATNTIRDKVTGEHTVQDSLIGEDGTVSVKVKDGSANDTADDSSVFTLTKSGYAFKGWATKPNLTGDELTANITETKEKLKAGLDSADYSSETYYAIWEPKSVEVTFDGNGGTYSDVDDKSSYTQNVVYDKSTALETNKFTRPGYHFVKWATEVYEGNAVNNVGYNDGANIFFSSEDEETYKKGTTLYAIWEENPSHKLVYDNNGGYGGPGVIDFVEGIEGKIYISEQFGTQTDDGKVSEVETVSMPSRDGYKFLGWAEDKTATGAAIGHEYVKSSNKKESEEVKYPTWISKSGDSDRTLFAIWHKIPESDVNYLVDNNDSAAVFKSKTYKEDDEFTLYFDRTPAKEGYDFVGWSADKDVKWNDEDASEKIYKSGDAKSYKMKDKDVTFYPVWKPHTYKVIYYTSNDETISSEAVPVAFDAEYQLCDVVSGSSISSNSIYDIASKTDAEKFAAKPGYKFTGWSTIPNGSVDYETGAKVSGLSSTDGMEIKLYAVYEPIKTVFTLVNKYVVNSFDENMDSVSEDEELGEIIVGEPMPILTKVPTKYGYKFGGYFTEKDGQGEMYYTKDLATVSEHTLNDVSEDTTLYAYWIPDTYTLFYENNGQQVGSQEVYYGQDITTLSQDELSGLTLEDDTVLVGWQLQKDSGMVDFGKTGDAVKMLKQTNMYKDDAGNIILYAVTGKSTKSTVSYNPNGGSNEPVDGTRYDAGDKVDVNFTKIPKKTGYTFRGWAYSSGADDPVFYETDDETDLNAKTSFTISGDTVLYAVWKANRYTITYHKNFTETSTGSGISASAVESKESQVKDTLGYEDDDYQFKGDDTFTRTGYTLSGWAITSETGVTYTLGQKLPSALTGVDGGNVDLYAVWTANSYTVGYDENTPENAGAEVKGTMKDTKMTYDSEGTLRANAYRLAGYKFMGWSTTPDGAVEYKDSEEVKNLCTEGRTILYAVWKNRADLTDDELDDTDWSELTMVAIMSNIYSVSVNAGEKPNLDKLVITAVYTGGACRTVTGYTTNIDTLNTEDDTSIVVTYTENNVTKTLEIPVRVKNKKAAPTETPSATPTVEPTVAPTVEPTVAPTEEPTVAPTEEPTVEPTVEPTTEPASNSAIKGTNKRIYLTSKVTGKKKNKVQVSWKKLAGATKYTVYGNINGKRAVVIKNIKYNKKTKTYKYTVSKIAKKALSKKKNYFFYVIGYKYVNGQRVRVGRSYSTYVTMKKTKKGYGNVKTVSFKKNKMIKYNKKKKQNILTLKLNKKKNKVFTIKTKLKYVSGKKQIKKPALLYYTSNKKIATVNKKGKITAKKKGKCSIYVVARNGVYKVLTVNVKKK